MGRGGGKSNKQGKNKSKKNNNKASASSSSVQQSTGAATATTAGDFGDDNGLIFVDPSRVRFQYSRIRPYFSGCGRSVASTLESIRGGEMMASDLPPIQVIVGPDDGQQDDSDDGDGRDGGSGGQPWYFSLNNRRLWVLKRCREEGLLESTNGLIGVRVRQFKSKKESERYTLKNCSVEAKFMREKDPNAKKEGNKKDERAVVDLGVDSSNEVSDDDGINDNVPADEDKETRAKPTLEGENEFRSNDGGESSESSDSDDDDDDGYVNRFSLLM